MSNPTGKVAVITGGNGGVGFAAAHELRVRGAEVAVSGRNTRAAEKAARRLGDDSFGRYRRRPDVRDVGALEGAFQAV